MLPQTEPSTAFIFRDAERNCGTQLFDEIERLIDADEKSRAALMQCSTRASCAEHGHSASRI